MLVTKQFWLPWTSILSKLFLLYSKRKKSCRFGTTVFRVSILGVIYPFVYMLVDVI